MLIYKITNKINKKCYIGQTHKTLQKRWSEHYTYKKSAIGAAIKKYDQKNFEVKVLAKCNSDEELNHRETYFIKLFNSRAPQGYNLKSGGARGKHSAESLKKLSLALKGRIGPNLGKKFSKEHKQKLSEAKQRQWKDHVPSTRKPYIRKGPSYHRRGSIHTLESNLQNAVSQGAGKPFVVCDQNGMPVWY